MDFWEYLLKEGYYVRVLKAEYEAYIGKAPKVYDGRKYVYLFLEAEEPIPEIDYDWPLLLPGEYVEGVDITENVPLKTEKEGYLYQYLRGCKTMCRQYTESPLGNKAMRTDKLIWNLPNQPNIGYLDESISPWDSPSPISAIYIVKGVSIGMTVYNPTPVPLKPRTRFIGKKFLYSVVEDKELIEKLEKRLIPSKPITFVISLEAYTTEIAKAKGGR